MNKNIPQLESFDSFFSGIEMKDEKNAIKLYEKYILNWHSSSIKEILEGEIERLTKYDQLPVQVKLESPYYWEGYQKCKSDIINHLESIISKIKV